MIPSTLRQFISHLIHFSRNMWQPPRPIPVRANGLPISTSSTCLSHSRDFPQQLFKDDLIKSKVRCKTPVGKSNQQPIYYIISNRTFETSLLILTAPSTFSLNHFSHQTNETLSEALESTEKWFLIFKTALRLNEITADPTISIYQLPKSDSSQNYH